MEIVNFQKTSIFKILYFSFSDTTKPITELINHIDNQIFCINVVHIISQMADILCNACGGLLPLLASSTSASVFERINKKK
jgi:hypothetical protein